MLEVPLHRLYYLKIWQRDIIMSGFLKSRSMWSLKGFKRFTGCFVPFAKKHLATKSAFQLRRPIHPNYIIMVPWDSAQFILQSFEDENINSFNPFENANSPKHWQTITPYKC